MVRVRIWQSDQNYQSQRKIQIFRGRDEFNL